MQSSSYCMRLRGEVNTLISKRNADVEREEWPFGRAPEASIVGFSEYIEEHAIAKSSRRLVRLGVDRVLWCLEHNFDEGSLVAFALEAAKLRIRQSYGPKNSSGPRCCARHVASASRIHVTKLRLTTVLNCERSLR